MEVFPEQGRIYSIFGGYSDTWTAVGAVYLVEKAKASKGRRSKNKLQADPKAKGDHTTFKRNPKGFDSVKRYDVTGKAHANPVTGEKLMPHVHDKTVPGEVRKPLPWEIPGKQ